MREIKLAVALFLMLVCCKRELCATDEVRDVWNSLTVVQEARVETSRSGEPDPRCLKIPGQFNREGPLQLLCRLAAREERQERLLRIIRPHSLREYFVLKLHCLL